MPRIEPLEPPYSDAIDQAPLDRIYREQGQLDVVFNYIRRTAGQRS
ncbi:hypothetical protein ACWD0A_24285 [Streptomyces sp. NPDC002867]